MNFNIIPSYHFKMNFISYRMTFAGCRNFLFLSTKRCWSKIYQFSCFGETTDGSIANGKKNEELANRKHILENDTDWFDCKSKETFSSIVTMQRNVSSFVEKDAELSSMEMVALNEVQSSSESMSGSVIENDTQQPIRALIYTTCYNVLDG